MLEDNVITHQYSGRFTTSVSASKPTYSNLDGSSFTSELSVEFVGNMLFSMRESKYSSTSYSDQLNTFYQVGANQSLFSKRLSNRVYQDFSSGTGGGTASSSASGGWAFPSSSKAGTETSATGRPDSGATGELDDSFASPVGDMLLPMLLMIGIYAIVRFFKNHKKQLALESIAFTMGPRKFLICGERRNGGRPMPQGGSQCDKPIPTK